MSQATTISNTQLEHFLTKARSWLLAQRIHGDRWDYHAYLGSHFLAQYGLCLKWLEVTESDADPEQTKTILLSTQLADGSWDQVRDANINKGELNATIFNYWFLKS